MKQDWLWDRKINVFKAKKILKHPEDSGFILMATLLLARKADPSEVFRDYLDPVVFCRNWQKIKRRMAQDKWANHRIIYWQAIYEKLLKKYHQKGMYLVRNRDTEPHDPICVAIGRKVREAREEAGLSQKELADRAGFCQQFISRIERGKENISLITLKKISKPFGKEAEVNFV